MQVGDCAIYAFLIINFNLSGNYLPGASGVQVEVDPRESAVGRFTLERRKFHFRSFWNNDERSYRGKLEKTFLVCEPFRYFIYGLFVIVQENNCLINWFCFVRVYVRRIHEKCSVCIFLNVIVWTKIMFRSINISNLSTFSAIIWTSRPQGVDETRKDYYGKYKPYHSSNFPGFDVVILALRSWITIAPERINVMTFTQLSVACFPTKWKTINDLIAIDEIRIFAAIHFACDISLLDTYFAFIVLYPSGCSILVVFNQVPLTCDIRNIKS
jgi:hypothetical protein